MKKRDLTQGSVIRALLVVALPTMLTQLLSFSYNIVDLKFVSSLGTVSIAAVGSAALFIGFGMSANALTVVGTGIKTSQAVGKNDYDSYHLALNTGYFLNIVINLVIMLIFIAFPVQLLQLLNISDQTVIEEATIYLRIISIALFFQLTNMLIMRVLGSLGLSDRTLYISAVGFAINIILDPIFIYTLNMGVAGAAIASLIGHFSTMMLFFILYYSTLKYTFAIKLKKSETISSLRLGVPYMLQRLVFTFVGIWLGRLVAGFGIEAIAASKIGLQVESITFMVIGGMFAAMSGFAGQNLGASEYDRIRVGYRSAIKIGLGYALFTSTVFLFFADDIARLFDDNALTVEYTAYYLRIIAFAQMFAVLEMIGNGLYTGIGRPKIPAAISISITVLRIPIAVILSTYFGVIGVFMSVAITTVVKGLVSYGIYRFKISKEIGTSIVSVY